MVKIKAATVQTPGIITSMGQTPNSMDPKIPKMQLNSLLLNYFFYRN